jgi:hypothetical protein
MPTTIQVPQTTIDEVAVDVEGPRKNTLTPSEMELSHETKHEIRTKRRRRRLVKAGSGSFLKRLRDELRKPVVGVKDHLRLTINLLIGSIFFFGVLTMCWHSLLAHLFVELLGLGRAWFLVLPAAIGFLVVLLLLIYSGCLVETVDDEALVAVVKDAIGFDDEQLQQLGEQMGGASCGGESVGI